MTQKDPPARRLWRLVVGAAALVGVLVLFSATMHIIVGFMLQRSGVEVTAMVDEHGIFGETCEGDPDCLRYGTVSFTTPDGQRHSQDLNLPSEYLAGDTVRIVYHPSSPSQYLALSPRSSFEAARPLVLIGLLLLTPALWELFRMIKRDRVVE